MLFSPAGVEDKGDLHTAPQAIYGGFVGEPFEWGSALHSGTGLIKKFLKYTYPAPYGYSFLINKSHVYKLSVWNK